MAKQLRRFLRRIIVITLLASLVIIAVSSKFFWQVLYPLPYKNSIFTHAEAQHVDPYLVAAIIRSESKFITGAKSSKGAIGLMQLMPETAAWGASELNITQPSEKDLFKADLNIRLGSWFLKQLLEEFDDNLPIVLAAYNAGSGRVREWLRKGTWDGSEANIADIPFAETRHYVKAVLRSYTVYRQIYTK